MLRVQDDKQALASCVQRSLETVHRAVVGSTPSDRGGVADNEMVALLDRHLVERRSTHQVVDPFCTCRIWFVLSWQGSPRSRKNRNFLLFSVLRGSSSLLELLSGHGTILGGVLPVRDMELRGRC